MDVFDENYVCMHGESSEMRLLLIIVIFSIHLFGSDSALMDANFNYVAQNYDSFIWFEDIAITNILGQLILVVAVVVFLLRALTDGADGIRLFFLLILVSLSIVSIIHSFSVERVKSLHIADLKEYELLIKKTKSPATLYKRYKNYYIGFEEFEESYLSAKKEKMYVNSEYEYYFGKAYYKGILVFKDLELSEKYLMFAVQNGSKKSLDFLLKNFNIPVEDKIELSLQLDRYCEAAELLYGANRLNEGDEVAKKHDCKAVWKKFH